MTKKKPHLCNARRQFLKTCISFTVSLVCLQLSNPLLMSCSRYVDEGTTVVDLSSEETGITYDASTTTLTIPFTSQQGINLQSAGSLETIDTIDSNDIYVMIANINGNIVAYSSICPHASVYNQWSLTSNQFVCGSHNSIFSSTGEFSAESSTSGVNNLTQYTVTTTDTDYNIKLS